MYSLTHLSDQTLLRELAALVTRDRANTVAMLAHLAEVDDRRLYVPAGYPSMYLYCVRELHLCEQAAFHRIRAARAARQFPAIFTAMTEGRLHLSAVVLLAGHLRPENAEELLGAAAGKSKTEIELLLAQRFPRPDVPARVRLLSAPPSVPQSSPQLSPGIVDASPISLPDPGEEISSPRHASSQGPGQQDPSPVEGVAPRPALRLAEPCASAASPAAHRYSLQVTMSQELHEKLRYAQQLLSHQVPSGDVAKVLERALDALIPALEKQKFAATSRPGKPRTSGSARHIPAYVKRAVWKRDGGRCTFVSESGQRCPATGLLEYDHVHEVARGGTASVSGIRLRCRAHNQYEAERTFGVEFMRRKREETPGPVVARATV